LAEPLGELVGLATTLLVECNAMSLDVVTKPLIECDELVGDGLHARCLVLATSLNQRLFALVLFPATVQILFYLLAVCGKKIREELPQRVRGTL